VAQSRGGNPLYATSKTIITMKSKFSIWLREYAEFFFYGMVVLGLMVWQLTYFFQVVRIHQDLLVASCGLQLLNSIYGLIVVKKMRLLAQLLYISAIIFGAIVIYYLKVTLLNVI